MRPLPRGRLRASRTERWTPKTSTARATSRCPLCGGRPCAARSSPRSAGSSPTGCCSSRTSSSPGSSPRPRSVAMHPPRRARRASARCSPSRACCRRSSTGATGSTEAASTAFFSLLIGGCLLTIGSLALSPVMGLYFHSHQVELLAAALSGWLFLAAMTVVPDALLQRRLSFARRVAADPLGAVAFAGAAIAAAAAGAGPWALVAGSYASVIVEVIAVWAFAGFVPRLKQASVAMWRELGVMARPVLVSEMFSKVASQVDAVFLGRVSGAAPLGQYRNGYRLASQPPRRSRTSPRTCCCRRWPGFSPSLLAWPPRLAAWSARWPRSRSRSALRHCRWARRSPCCCWGSGGEWPAMRSRRSGDSRQGPRCCRSSRS